MEFLSFRELSWQSKNGLARAERTGTAIEPLQLSYYVFIWKPFGVSNYDIKDMISIKDIVHTCEDWKQ